MTDDIHGGGPPAPPLQIAMLLHPGLTLLDLAGPQAALGMHGRTHLVGRTMEPVLSDTGLAVLPTTTYEDCPTDLDMLFVPGGQDTAPVMRGEAALDFLRRQAGTARFVTSVCTGSLILGPAGLLDGHSATTHWAFYDVPRALGVEVSDARVVIDGSRVTGGVTAGIDFGLVLLERLRGRGVAIATQLALEYDPAPLFDAGSPKTAAPALKASVRAVVAGSLAELVGIARGRGTPSGESSQATA